MMAQVGHFSTDVDKWARRVRELDVEFGYRITTQVLDSGLRPGQYRLESTVPDLERAELWRFMNELRNNPELNAHEKLIGLLKRQVGRAVDGDDLLYVANQKEWARRIRELRQERGGWQISSYLNRGDLKQGQYVLESLDELPPWDRVDAKVWQEVLARDLFMCQECRWSKSDPPSSGRRYLEVHHKRHVAQKGEPVPENLEALCNKCHDARHAEEAKT